jgi:hypothetical protein
LLGHKLGLVETVIEHWCLHRRLYKHWMLACYVHWILLGPLRATAHIINIDLITRDPIMS